MISRFRIAIAFLVVVAFMLPASAESDKELVKQGIKAFHAREYKKAIQIFGSALSTEFNNPVLHYYMANSYAESGKNEAAIREYRIAHALDPDSDAGKYSKQALDKLTDDFAKDKQPEVTIKPKAPTMTKEEQALKKTMSSLDKQASSAASSQTAQTQQKASSYSRLADDVVNRTRIEMLKDMVGKTKSPRLTRQHKQQLEQLRQIYEDRQRNQITSGYRHVNEIQKSSQNLKSLLQEEKSATGHHLKSQGTNLYVRNYGSGKD